MCPNRNSTSQTLSDGSELRAEEWPRMDPSPVVRVTTLAARFAAMAVIRPTPVN